MIKSIKHVAVVTPHKRDFMQYETDNACLGTIYHHVRTIYDLRGIIFSRRVLLYGLRNIKDVNEILYNLSTRIIGI